MRRLGFVSTGELEFEEVCPDYLDLLSVPGDESVCAGAFWTAIEGIKWDYCELNDVPAGSALVGSERRHSRMEQFSRGQCPVADISGGFEAYLGRLSPHGRRRARQLLRKGERAGAILEVASAEQRDATFAELVRLHQTRWQSEGKPGVFAAHRFVAFHLALLRDWLPSGQALLARLALNGEPVAVLYGFVTGAKFDFYQSGIQIDTADRLKSPGNLAHLLLMHRLSSDGVIAYDFLRGASSYKQRLATDENELIGLQVWRTTWRSRAYGSVRRTVRLLRSYLHRRGDS